MRKQLLTLPLLAILLLAGCSANDPIKDSLYSEASYIRVASDEGGGYWREHNEEAVSLSPGSSGATFISPGASSLGGWRLDTIGEWLYFDIAIEDDYDGVSDAEVQIFFEVNVDNTGGNDADTVDFQLEFWCKSLGERTTTNRTYNISTVVGKADQHDLFVATVACEPIVESIVAFRLELITITSDIDNVIVNYVKLRYPTYVPVLERP